MPSSTSVLYQSGPDSTCDSNRILQQLLINGFTGIIGITLDAFWAEPKDPTKPEDHEAAERYLQMHVNI